VQKSDQLAAPPFHTKQERKGGGSGAKDGKALVVEEGTAQSWDQGANVAGAEKMVRHAQHIYVKGTPRSEQHNRKDNCFEKARFYQCFGVLEYPQVKVVRMGTDAPSCNGNLKTGLVRRD